jgi:ribonuclease III
VELEDYKFKNINLLKIALTHPSAVKNKVKDISYERMEFLGDSILNVVIADIVYHKFTNHSEGQLSIILANLVNSKTIVMVAKKLDLGNKIILDNGEEQSGGRENPNNLENALEAIIASIYLDSDFSTIKNIISKWWADFFIDIDKLFQKDYKSQLQELLQKRYKILPKYITEDRDGEPHEPTFTISVSFKNKYKFEAQGKTKKEAEQGAAKEMLNFINEQDE